MRITDVKRFLPAGGRPPLLSSVGMTVRMGSVGMTIGVFYSETKMDADINNFCIFKTWPDFIITLFIS